MSVQPIKPNEVKAKGKSNIHFPDAIIEAVNELIQIHYDGKSATVFQKDIVDLALKKDSSLTSEGIYDNNLLDIENLFANNGWNVTYDKPGYNETYNPTFTFSKKK